MMFTRIGLALIAICGAISGCADSISIQSRSFKAQSFENVKTVAVIDFAGDFGGQAVADILTMELMKAGYKVVERDNLRRIIDEQKMGAEESGQLDLTEQERLELIGRNITADLIITGNLVRLTPVRYERESDKSVKFPPATCEITARAADSVTGRVVWTCIVNVTARARNGTYVWPLDWITEACAELVESLKNPQYQDKSESYSGSKIETMRKARASHI
ncbi:MAG: hypothetical protein O7B26_11690 [Planctomycetota bacterium]|nr:hypothetical protein [Planctomycetota bacterium]